MTKQQFTEIFIALEAIHQELEDHGISSGTNIHDVPGFYLPHSPSIEKIPYYDGKGSFYIQRHAHIDIFPLGAVNGADVKGYKEKIAEEDSTSLSF